MKLKTKVRKKNHYYYYCFIFSINSHHHHRLSRRRMTYLIWKNKILKTNTLNILENLVNNDFFSSTRKLIYVNVEN